ncbi:MAG: cbb3-type cytochrome c oxidase subunit I [Myxococcaceae bacterium]|nr:cbb3-type cytochrome c oxidase subunit I [Myxococcaceae bacterium]
MRIARRYLWCGFAALAVGGLLAMLIRFQWAYPGRPVPLWGKALTPAGYQSVFTLHGLTMIFFAVTPLLIGAMGTLLVPSMVGAGRLAFPRLASVAWWLFLLSELTAFASCFVELGAPGNGWTMYPPLSTKVESPGPGQTVMLVAMLLWVVSSVMTAVNLLTTLIRGRANGLGWMRLPLTAWGLFLTSLLTALFLPVLGVAAGLLFADRELGTSYFAARTGNPLLYQHLFWIFGHPEVYILILPVWGVVGDFVAFFSRKPAFWYRGTVYAMCAITAMSGLVYAHHMFVAGIGPMLGRSFMILTLLISLPGEVMFLNWLLTLWRGSIRLDSPMLFALGTMIVFGIGGLSGLYLGAIATDIPLHDTMFVVGHFHLTMAAATFLGTFGAIYFWFPKLYGRQLNETLAKVHFWLTAPLLLLVFGGQLLAGYMGQPRRLFDPYVYEFLHRVKVVNHGTTMFAFVLGAAQLVFVWNLIATLRRPATAVDNPWRVGTLEWTTRAVPGGEAAPALVVRRGPHELSNPEVLAATGRDYIGQAE